MGLVCGRIARVSFVVFDVAGFVFFWRLFTCRLIYCYLLVWVVGLVS